MHRAATSCIAAGLLLAAAPATAELTIPGSGNPEYVLGVLAKEYGARQGTPKVVIPPSTGTAGAIRDVLAAKTEVGRVGRPPSEAERAKGVAYTPIGRDAVVFVAGAGVTVRGVTRNQMVDAYTGKITDWRDLGGKSAPVRVIGREAGDSSRSAVAGHIPAFRDMVFGAGVKVVHLDPQMIELLDRFDTSLGMLNRSALHAARTKVVPLALEGIEPTAESLASGRYPIWLEFGFIHKAGVALGPQARAFVAYVKSPEGARVLREHGVSPL
jgi:phosphate transport system substrate-binding protein